MSHPRFLRTGNLARVQLFATCSDSVAAFLSMPVAVITEQEQTELINKLESNLGSILEEKGVRRDVQAVISQLEIRNCETFCNDGRHL